MTQLLAPSSAPSSAAIQIELIDQVARWDAIRENWQRLHASSQSGPTLDFDWLRTWWDVYGKAYGYGRHGLMILTGWHAGELVAALPLYVRRPSLCGGARVACFIGTGEREHEEICPDYLDVLAGDPRAAGLLLESLTGRHAGRYDRLELLDIADQGVVPRWAREALLTHELEIIPRGQCPIADLRGGMEAYLARLSANERQHSRRILKQARSLGVCLEVADSSRFDEFFADLIELHQERWQAAGDSGCFASQRFTDFHRTLARQWVREGKAMLSRLRWGEHTVAVKYGFLHHAKYDFYQSGVKREVDERLRSPGTVSFLMLFEHLAGQGVEMFDFLRGSSNYKQRLATRAQPLVGVRWVRWTWRSQVGCAGRLARRGGARLAAMFPARRRPARRAGATAE